MPSPLSIKDLPEQDRHNLEVHLRAIISHELRLFRQHIHPSFQHARQGWFVRSDEYWDQFVKEVISSEFAHFGLEIHE